MDRRAEWGWIMSVVLTSAEQNELHAVTLIMM